MAQHLIPQSQKIAALTALALSPVLVSHAAAADNLPDPTRPPAIAGPAHSGSGAAPGAAAAPVLQSIMISPHRRMAIISGETVKLGEKFGDAQVVKITETEVVLRTGKELQTLKLYPALEKRPASFPIQANPRGQGK
jgi:MSHA biogenesis protein MshK